MSFCGKKTIKKIEQKVIKRPPWYEIAKEEIGTKEVEGEYDNPRIILYHRQTTYKATHDEVPWCSAFVNWCMNQAGINGTMSAAARSWMQWGVPLSAPKKGCVVVFWRESRSSWKGHVGFYVGRNSHGHIKCLGGNQNNEVNISTYSPERVLGFRWPQGEG